MRLLGVIGLMLGLSLLHVQASQGQSNDVTICQDVTTQGMLACASRNYKVADADLNASYKVAMGMLSAQNKIQMRKIQRAWLSFRDTYCTGIYDEVFPGREAAVEKETCLWRLTENRAIEIKRLKNSESFDKRFDDVLLAQQHLGSTPEILVRELVSKYSIDRAWTNYGILNCKLSLMITKESLEVCHARINYLRGY